MRSYILSIGLFLVAIFAVLAVLLSIRSEDLQSPYLTITESEYADSQQTKVVSNCYTYDISAKRLKKQGSVLNTAGFPMTIYSTNEQQMLYVGYSGNGDQLFSKNGDQQLTDELCAFNHAFQCGESLFLAAKYLEHYCIEPIMLDMSDGMLKQILPDEKDDTFTWSASNDPQNRRVVFSCYSDSEMRQAVNSYEGNIDLGEYPENPSSTIFIYDLDSKKLKKVYKTEEYLCGIAADDKFLYYCASSSSLSPKEENKLYRVSFESQKREIIPCSFFITGDMAVWNNVLYFVGWFQGRRGCYSYNLENHSVEKIFLGPQSGFVNGMSMNY